MRSAVTVEDLRRLGKFELFRALSPAQKAWLARAGQAMTVPRDTLLWRRGARPKYVYIILSGRIGLLDATDDGDTVIDLFLAGTAIGGPLALKPAPYLYSGKALDEARAVRVPLAVYRRWLLANQSLLIGTMLHMVEQWHTLTRAVRDLKQLSANQRLGHYLLALSGKARGPVTVRLADDLDLMARILGVTRESLSRSFGQLRAHGVTKRAKLVTIADVRQLSRYCASRPRK